MLKELPEVEEKIGRQIEQYEAQLAAAKENLGKAFPQEEELKRVNARLVELNAELDVGGTSASAVVLDDDGDDAPEREQEPRRQKNRCEEVR